ncbi:MAG: arsenate reductase ArsC [Candidatus Omnitrophica bacterium]|nr:arsenate reductase ArsC [Candidatus Omnitrophota bacterium]
MLRKRLLFASIENSCRSQMAEAFARKLAKKKIEIYSAGARPSFKVDLNAIKVMEELDIDISAKKPKRFNQLPVKRFDYVVRLGHQGICLSVLTERLIEWNIEDPKGKDLDFYRKIRDKIKQNVEELIKEILQERI